jgi:N-acetylneuraminate synthase
VVAELSANHNQDFEQAARLVRAAKECGADAVKPDAITINSDAPCFRIGGGTLWDGRTLYDLYAQAHMPWEWQPKLKAIANELNLALFSSAFDPTAVEFLERMGVPAHKIASPELVDIPLIQEMAKTGKPLILSTGMGKIEEIEEAIAAARAAGARQLALLRCTSAYPAPPGEMDLRSIADMTQRFGLPIGISDHTRGTAVSIAAVALGACIVEKHLTLSRTAGGPDSEFSLEPAEFKSMVSALREVEKSLGRVRYGPAPHEGATLRFRRSLFVVADIKKGQKFDSTNVRSIRPACGLHPRHLPEVLGRQATRDVQRGTALAWDMVDAGHAER